jgi:wyosine [tRNA(Phe)-imidazoG37] synthetase (radical SAM superfamily)
MPPEILPETAKLSSVYGPVDSWRVGRSLGVDLLLKSSICSFNCIYCQLGEIQTKTLNRQIYVTTDQVERDLKESDWESADIITFSGSGEPTLALNLAECIEMIRDYTHKPIMVLTNATTLHLPEVRADLALADIVAAKLDGATEAMFAMMNRPVAGVQFKTVIEGLKTFRQGFKGKFALQCMFMTANLNQVEAMAELIESIHPDEVQLNTPRRPYPLTWHLDSRGNHAASPVEARSLNYLNEEQANTLEASLRSKITVPILSFYKK